MVNQFYTYFFKAAFLTSICILFFSYQALATHIRAGEITITSDPNDPLSFVFTFTGYRDRGSSIEFGGGVFKFGDGSSIERDFRITEVPVSDEISKVTFTVSHTYDGPGPYIVSYEEEYRNADILNMDNSVNTTFYVETYFEIDPFLGENRYPILTVPPIDFAAIGALFIHNPGATDQDGDSLAYKFVTPKQGRDMEVNNYRPLNAPEFYSNFNMGSEELTPPKLSLDALSGDLVWNAPGDAIQSGVREYNVAFRVEEWRKREGRWFLISWVTRDMQIIVVETDNERPELVVPDDLCVEAGTSIQEIIQGNDPDGDPVKLEAFGGPFEVTSPATYSPNPGEFGGPPQFLTFNWNTVCGHVRLRPYEVQFKATDDPEIGPSLVNFETFEITVVGPAPTGLETNVEPGRSIQLSWDPYSCSNADSMQIWRRVGDYDIMFDDCTIGMPGNTGYELIDLVPINQTTYLDHDDGAGLAPGANYCYRLVAKFNSLTGDALSYVSASSCDSLILDAPAITNVDVLATGFENGEILVRWVPPYQVDPVAAPPSYTYDLFRGEGEGPSEDGYTLIAQDLSDTVFTDTGINTQNFQYNYYVRFYDSGGVLVDSSATASSVRLLLRPLLKAIEVNWDANVPWSLRSQNYPYHYIYRDRILENDPDQLVLIDSVNVNGNGLRYLDDGDHNDTPLDEEIEYCYFVTTNGSYSNKLFPEPLINNSQISCAQPNDTIAPCSPPELILANGEDCTTITAGLSCGVNVYENVLEWLTNEDPNCDDDVVFYNIYYSNSGEEGTFEIIDTSFDTDYTHDNLPSLKGCYKVTAVDRSGNESAFSETICNDNCPVYILPNVFTPNGDGKNDVFTPKHNSGLNIQNFDNSECPRFVRSVVFTVYDRNGNEIYNYDSFEDANGIYINWDAKNNLGEPLPAGVYYYSADVRFDRLDPKDEEETFKGWVQILR